VQGLNPFYLFQAYTVILWSLQYYWKFAVIIAITSVISVTVSVWETRRVSPGCTHKKENTIFLIYKEEKKMHKIFSPYLRRSLVMYDFAPDPSEFPNI
jgi:hypothetical protein